MIFRCEEIVSWASRDATLLPGTIIMTGTAEGIGAARDPPVYMVPASAQCILYVIQERFWGCLNIAPLPNWIGIREGERER